MVQLIYSLDENEPPDVFVYESDLYQYEILLAIMDDKIEKLKTQLQEESAIILSAVNFFLSIGKDIPAIAEIFDISIEEATDLVHQIEAKKP